MNTMFQSVKAPSVKGLADAIARNASEDALGKALSPKQWDAIAPYLQPFSLPPSQVLIPQGTLDRTVYFLESGGLSVHFEDYKGRVHLAIVNAGAAVGEGGFFSNMPRNATVQSVGECRLWKMHYSKFLELSQNQPTVALALAMGLAATITRRMTDRRKKVSVT
jgi:CRP-like cAMP-binding protein